MCVSRNMTMCVCACRDRPMSVCVQPSNVGIVDQLWYPEINRCPKGAAAAALLREFGFFEFVFGEITQHDISRRF